MATHRAFLRLPVGIIKKHANNEEIAIAIENMERMSAGCSESACLES
jgi:hypothetical protein